MTSSRPYLIRALHAWIVDNGMTPYLMADAQSPDVHVPRDYVQEGKIVLNISPQAVRGLGLENDAIRFSARFGGLPLEVVVPTSAVLAIYAKENGQGMAFHDPGNGHEPPDAPTPQPERPRLKVVK